MRGEAACACQRVCVHVLVCYIIRKVDKETKGAEDMQISEDEARRFRIGERGAVPGVDGLSAEEAAAAGGARFSTIGDGMDDADLLALLGGGDEGDEGV